MPKPKEAPGPASTDRPFTESLCWRCLHHREIQGARSTFVMCSALPVKYPGQPVRACVAFREDSTC